MIEKMLEEAILIFNYSNEVSDEYNFHGDQMLFEVNESMAKLHNITDILGGNPISLIEDNHKNHLQFMKTVIKHKQSDLLIHTLPWVYKSYSAKGIDYIYFIEELKCWIKAIENNISSTSKENLIKIYEAMIKWHDNIIILSEEDFEKLDESNTWTDEHDIMLKYLLLGDFRNIKDICQEKLIKGLSITKLYLDYIQPLMYKVGDLWEDGQISVAHEHLATSIVAQLIASLYPDYVLNDITKGVAIISAGLNEYHQIGARMVADILENDGWDIRYLGANIPSDQLIQLIKEIQPVFVGLSITMSYHVDKLVDTVNEIKNLNQNKSTRIMVGGLAINNSKELQHIINADSYPYDANDSKNIARQWWEEYENNVE